MVTTRPFPVRRDDRFMVLEQVQGIFGGGDHFDIETLEQGAGAKIRQRQLFVDGVVIIVRRLRPEGAVQAEHFQEGVIQPGAAGRAAEDVIMLGEPLPDLAPVLFHRAAAAVLGRDADALQGDADAVEQAQQIMVGPQQQADRILERLRHRQTRPDRYGRAG